AAALACVALLPAEPFCTRTPTMAAAHVALFGCLAVAGRAALALRHGRAGEHLTYAGLLAAAGAGGAYALSMSWVVWEPMAFPGLAVVLALALGSRRAGEGGKAALVLACLGLIATAAARKLEAPFGWGFWREPPLREAVVRPSAPELAGLRLSPQTARFYDELPRLIRAHTHPGEPVLLYPHLSVLHALADRPPATFARQHWFDVCPDAVVARDAAHVLRHPPALIVEMRMGPEVYRLYEELYRGGRACGQRQMGTTLDTLRPGYERVATFPVPGSGLPVEVWVRRDRR
ncbi:MAG TPA: hypothetical protein VIL46_14955, partial [Gemmataceae bacterium]